jgi:hypothetical protein
MLGTEWVAVSEGSTIRELLVAFQGFRYEENLYDDAVRTNLRLTGAPIQKCD